MIVWDGDESEDFRNLGEEAGTEYEEVSCEGDSVEGTCRIVVNLWECL